MKRKKLILYDSDTDYVQRMSEYLEHCEEFPFTIYSYTERDKLLEFLETDAPDLFLVAESVYIKQKKMILYKCMKIVIYFYLLYDEIEKIIDEKSQMLYKWCEKVRKRKIDERDF